MPKLKDSQVPSYRLHKQSGQAVVTLSGKDHLLGKHESRESREKYDRLIAEWINAGRRIPAGRRARPDGHPDDRRVLDARPSERLTALTLRLGVTASRDH
jgi:hypothetical protein